MHPIRSYCERHGITQSEFARLCGISAPYVSQIISGRERIGAGAARRIAKASNGEISVSELIEWEAAA